MFQCSCEVAFALAISHGIVSSVENISGRDPHECPRARSSLEGVLSDLERAHALREVAAWKPEATVKEVRPRRAASDEVTARAVALLREAERVSGAKAAVASGIGDGLEKAARSAGGGRVSRPPRSASSKNGGNLTLSQTLEEAEAKRRSAYAALGLPYPQNRLCVTPPSSPAPDDTRTNQDAAGRVGLDNPDILADSLPLLLAHGVDTLEVSWFDVDLNPCEVARLEAHKLAVQAMPADGPEGRIVFGGESFQMKPSGGRRHQFMLVAEAGEVAISKCPSKTVPTLRVKLYSETLWRLGTRGAWEWMEKIIHKVHDPEGGSEEGAEQPKVPRSVVSRVDLCADFIRLPIERAELDEFVCRPRHKSQWKKLHEGWKRIPCGVEKGDLNHARWTSGLKQTGLTFGKGSMGVRIYDKVQEIKDQSPDKVWLFGHWMRCLCCGAAAVEHEAVFSPRVVTLDGPKAKDSKAPTLEGYGACEKTSCDAFIADQDYFMVERVCENCAVVGLDGSPESKGKVTVKIRCKACRAGKLKKLTCGACNGTGEVEAERKCGECRGAKMVSDRVWRVEVQYRREALSEFCKAVERTCWKCAGLGAMKIPRYACAGCAGKGGKTCVMCEGSGKTRRGPCRRCDGTGTRTCRRCGGEGYRRPTEVVCGTCRAAEGARDQKGLGWLPKKPDPREVVDPRLPLVLRAEVDESTGEVKRPLAGDDGKRGRALNTEDDLELLLDTLEGLMAGRGALWRYAMGGGRGVRAWLAWRKPSATEPQRTRWALRPEWVEVQRQPDWSKDDERRDELVRVQRKRAKWKKILPGLLGYMSTAVTLRRDMDEEKVTDFTSAVVLLEYECRELLAERERKGIKGSSWADVASWKLSEHGRWGCLGDEELRRSREELAMAGVA